MLPVRRGKRGSGLEAPGSSSANWRCIVLGGKKLSHVELLERCLAHRAQPFPPHRPASRRWTWMLKTSQPGSRAAERTVRQLPGAVAGRW